MRRAVFIAPYFATTTLRFIRAALSLDGVRLALVSHESTGKIPGDVAGRLGAYVRTENALDSISLERAVRRAAEQLGGVDAIVGAMEELQLPMAEVRASLGVAGMTVDVAKNFRDKGRMKDVFRSAGIPCARHAVATNRAAAEAFADRSGFPLVVKPPAGSGARSTFRIDGAAAFEDYLDTIPPSAETPALLEEFITGEEHSFDSILIDKKPVWYSVSRYLPTPLEVLRTPWIQWAVLLPREVDVPEFDPIRAAAAEALSALGLESGLTHMEWFRRNDGTIAISEVAARPPGAQFTTLLSCAHAADLYRGWAEVMILDRFDPPARKFAAGAAYLRGQGRGTVKAIHGIDRVARGVSDLVVEAKLPVKGQSPSGGYEGEGYVIVRHPQTAVVERALREIVTCVRVELG